MLIPSALLHAGLILAAFGWYGVTYRRSMPRLPFGLGLVSLMRFFSLVLPLGLLAPVARYAAVAVPLLAAMWLLKQRLGLPAESLGLRLTQASTQAWIALSGIPLGLAGYWILRPEPLMPGAGAGALAVGVLVLLRRRPDGRAALPRLSAVLCDAGARLCWGLAKQPGFCSRVCKYRLHGICRVHGAGGVGLQRVRLAQCSIWGVILAHALMITGMGLVWPLVFPLS